MKIKKLAVKDWNETLWNLDIAIENNSRWHTKLDVVL